MHAKKPLDGRDRFCIVLGQEFQSSLTKRSRPAWRFFCALLPSGGPRHVQGHWPKSVAPVFVQALNPRTGHIFSVSIWLLRQCTVQEKPVGDVLFPDSNSQDHIQDARALVEFAMAPFFPAQQPDLRGPALQGFLMTLERVVGHLEQAEISLENPSARG